MEIDTITGRVHVRDHQQLALVFRECRQGAFGAFDLSHQEPFPWLSILINDSLACLHYFPVEGHPGFQSQAGSGLPPTATDETVHFLQSSGSEGDSFDLPLSVAVPVELALLAAQQFFDTSALPNCIQWWEL